MFGSSVQDVARHSGLDPESSPYPFMDPGSKSPRGLGDVRHDMALEAGVE